jgi:uncharacterized membrane protein
VVSDVEPTRLDQLERRVRELEHAIASLRAAPQSGRPTPPPESISGAAPDATPAAWAPPAVVPQRPTIAVTELHRADVRIDSETILKWGGVGLVVLAVGFAVSTAISRGWIGPELQLAGALLLSAGLVVAGWRLRSTRPGWTHALCAAGVVSGFTTVASTLFRDQAADAVAYASTVVIAAIGIGLARRLPSLSTAAATVVAATIGWLVIGGDDPAVVASSLWMAVLVGGAIALALDRRWHLLRPLSEVVGMIALVGLAGSAGSSGERIVVVAVAAALAGALMWVPSLGDLSSAWQQFEVQLAIATTPWMLGVVTAAYEFDDDRPVGVAALAIAALVAVAAALVRARLQRAHFISLLVGASVGVSIGLGLLLSTEAALVGLAVQGAGLVVLGGALGHNLRVYVNAGVVTGLVAISVGVRMIEAWSDDGSAADDVAHLAMIVAVAAAGWLTKHRQVQMITGAVVLALVLDWLGSVLVHVPQGQAAVSASWAVVGTAVLVFGAVRKIHEVAVAGLLVLGMTVAKLLTVDLHEVDTLWRAALFLLIGLGFLRLGFLLPRLTGSDRRQSPESVDRVEHEVERR